MAPRESPAVARRRLRLELRKLREGRGLTQGDVARGLRSSLSKVNRIELGDIGISYGDLQEILRLLDVTDKAVIDRLNQHWQSAKVRGWWDRAPFRGLVTPGMIELLQFQGDAIKLYAFNSTAVPGIAQNRAYTQSILDLWSDDLSAEQRTTRLEFRMRLQDHVLNRPDPPECVLILDESVVYREVGSLQIMIDQLQELIALGRDGKAEIRVLPMSRSVLLSMEAPFVFIELGNSDCVVYRESTMGDELLDSADVISRYRRIVTQMVETSLSAEASLRLFDARRAALLSELDRRLT
jgi:transcriptional regulator with XRE-family HTH domain